MAEPVALCQASSYDEPPLANKVCQTLDASGIQARTGMTVLVKPNLLMALPLACASPAIVVSACAWLLDHGCRVTVADSPAFGTASSVAEAIGLTAGLRRLGITVNNFGAAKKVKLDLAPQARIGIAAQALECDLVLSIPRIKAHSQLRMTLAVKNCFGCVTGVRKALAHVEFGRDAARFADMIAAVWAALPSVGALYDGIIAMSGTGPRNGAPCQLGLLAASRSAPAGDLAILGILGLEPDKIPVQAALRKRGIAPEPAYPLAAPDQFSPGAFKAPARLKEVSFNPLRLGMSIVKRLVLSFQG